MNMEGGPDNEETQVKEVDSEVKKWQLTGYGVFKDSLTIDTLLDNFQIYHPMYQKAITTSYVGNYGTPYMDNNFFNREIKDVSFFFAKSRQGYMLTPDRLEYYNTTTPLTKLDFSQSENKSRKSETRFNVFHSQNVNPFWNFTFRFDQAKSLGQYDWQETKNNFITLYSSYEKDKWRVNGGLISNQIKGQENGGLVDESSIFSPDDSDYWPVNLTATTNQFNSSYYFSNVEYRVGRYDAVNDSVDVFRPVAGLIYSFQYERHKQEFKEEELNDSVFFPNTYYPEWYFNDSIRYNKLTNLVQLKQYENKNKKYTFGKRAFLGYEIARGSMPGVFVDDTTFTREQIKYSNIFAGAGIFRETGNFWRWRFDGRINLIGRNAGETEINGWITKPFRFLGDTTSALVLQGQIENRVADPFQEKFFSNHIRWDKDFAMQQRMTVGGEFVSKVRRYRLGAKYALINNFIYNDTLGIPTQTQKDLVVLSAYIDKYFNYRNFNLHTHVLWQQVSNEEFLHIPDFSVFVSAYYQLVISKVLYSQIGVDMRYNTKYYADAYSPNTGMFYLQNEKMYGDYPYIDVHANLRLKRTTVFFKLMNIGSNFLGKEFLTIPNYPMPQSTFRFGITWAFYD